jgi:multicomponent Na+:H+ antiporter subunit B
MSKSDIRIKRVIQRCGCDSILPLALVYICYIILHGHLSPGGGFQGGVLMTAVVILMYLGHGYKSTVRAFSFHLLHEAEGVASIAYVALALMGIAVGAQFCQNILYTYGVRGDLYSSGTIFWMNVVVGLKVITGIGSLSLLMLGVLDGRDVDHKE